MNDDIRPWQALRRETIYDSPCFSTLIRVEMLPETLIKPIVIDIPMENK